MSEMVKDLNGNVVKASDLKKGLIFREFEKGFIGWLRTENDSFYAMVECLSKRGNKYTFVSETYGHKFIVDFDADTVIRKG